VQPRLPPTPSYAPWLTGQGIGTRGAHTRTRATGASHRCPSVGPSAASCRGVDRPTSSPGPRTGPGHGNHGPPSVAWAYREAAQCARRLPPAAQRLDPRQFAKSRTNRVFARQAVAPTRSQACSDRRRDRVPSEATPAVGCALASRWGEAGGWGKSWWRTTPSDASQSQPLPEGLPPHGPSRRRLCRAPWQRWTREGALVSVRWTRLDTAGNRGVAGACPRPGADVWRSSETFRGLEPAGGLGRRIGADATSMHTRRRLRWPSGGGVYRAEHNEKHVTRCGRERYALLTGAFEWVTFPLCNFSEHACTFPADTRLCTKNPVSTLTHRSIRPF